MVPMSRRALLGRSDGLDLTEPSEHPIERLLAVLRELADGQDPGTSLDAIPTGIPRLTAARCAGNGACARTCPVGALALTSTVLAEAGADRNAMAQFQLTFAAGRCTDCGQCLRVCPESALQRSGGARQSAATFSFARARLTPGGSSMPILPADKLDIPLDFEAVRTAGSGTCAPSAPTGPPTRSGRHCPLDGQTPANDSVRPISAAGRLTRSYVSYDA